MSQQLESAFVDTTKSIDHREAKGARLGVLDGWRGISILLVLSAHMLPLGPSWLELNLATGLAGMSIFFTLSGFLITSTLIKHPSVPNFIIRRLARILPLAYLGIVVYGLVARSGLDYYVSSFLFLGNYTMLLRPSSHYWSLCVEMHFYLFIALLVIMLGTRGLPLLSLLALVVTGIRIHQNVFYGIQTYFRVDEILTGCTLALAWHGQLGRLGLTIADVLRRVPLAIWMLLFAGSCHESFGPLGYARPYLGTSMVGHTLLRDDINWSFLKSAWLRYIAEISYALYIIHPLTMKGWLGSGDKWIKYTKRPLSFALTFALAHLSTFHMERHFIAWSKQLTRHLDQRHAKTTG